MGQSFLFSCDKCNHALNSSGELDYGMMIVVKPYICSSCNDVVDVSVGKFGKIIPKTMLTESQKKEFNHCPDCDSQDLTEWDTKNHPCPKCGNKMEKSGPEYCWD